VANGDDSFVTAAIHWIAGAAGAGLAWIIAIMKKQIDINSQRISRLEGKNEQRREDDERRD